MPHTSNTPKASAIEVIEHYRLFEAGPRIQSLATASDNVNATLTRLCVLIQERIGQGKMLQVFPHRILNQRAWRITLIGEQATLYLLFDITGRFRLPIYPQEAWPARWVIDLVDHIDAYWLIEYLTQALDLTFEPIYLSTKDGDKTVNKAEQHNE
ncbi:hypothetical protein [Pasteurella testudinis]|uniref:hypothetical protein n=1 Tax=Pasteurella testudinis TaxID=761 RepID=UPI0040589BEE